MRSAGASGGVAPASVQWATCYKQALFTRPDGVLGLLVALPPHAQPPSPAETTVAATTVAAPTGPSATAPAACRPATL